MAIHADSKKIQTAIREFLGNAYNVVIQEFRTEPEQSPSINKKRIHISRRLVGMPIREKRMIYSGNIPAVISSKFVYRLLFAWRFIC